MMGEGCAIEADTRCLPYVGRSYLSPTYMGTVLVERCHCRYFRILNIISVPTTMFNRYIVNIILSELLNIHHIMEEIDVLSIFRIFTRLFHEKYFYSSRFMSSDIKSPSTVTISRRRWEIKNGLNTR